MAFCMALCLPLPLGFFCSPLATSCSCLLQCALSFSSYPSPKEREGVKSLDLTYSHRRNVSFFDDKQSNRPALREAADNTDVAARRERNRVQDSVHAGENGLAARDARDEAANGRFSCAQGPVVKRGTHSAWTASVGQSQRAEIFLNRPLPNLSESRHFQADGGAEPVE